MKMINKFFIVSLLVAGNMQAGKKTADALYWATKAGCYTGAAAALVTTAPYVVAASGPVAIVAPTSVTVAKATAVGAVAASESLAMKAYNFGMKL